MALNLPRPVLYNQIFLAFLALTSGKIRVGKKGKLLVFIRR